MSHWRNQVVSSGADLTQGYSQERVGSARARPGLGVIHIGPVAEANDDRRAILACLTVSDKVTDNRPAEKGWSCIAHHRAMQAAGGLGQPRPWGGERNLFGTARGERQRLDETEHSFSVL